MKRLLASLSLIYVITVSAQSLLVVQSAQIHDLYGNSIVTALLETEGIEQVDVFHARLFTHDSSEYSRTNLKRVLKAHVERAKPAEILFLGEPVIDVGVPYKYTPILVGSKSFNTTALTAARDYNPEWNKIYIVSGPSHVAQLRQANLQTHMDGFDVETFTVSTVADFQKRLLSLQDEPKGIIVLNAFTLLDEWKQDVGYAELEEILVSVNKRHLDVGLCRRKFDTALALGPTPEEAAALASSSYHVAENELPHISSCANLRRLSSKWLPVYRKSQGKFDIVVGGYD